jgi:hypothetical protein
MSYINARVLSLNLHLIKYRIIIIIIVMVHEKCLHYHLEQIFITIK